MRLLSLPEYEEQCSATRDARMAWWREARFGMFVHYGLYAQIGRNEWAMAMENIPIAEYEQLAAAFAPRKGAPREWAKLAAAAGMKYVVLTTKHHEGFCLWDSKLTDYTAARRGPKRDLVAEYVEACRAEGLRIGFYYSLMDWHHPDGWRCAFDPEARARFVAYTRGLVRELMTGYGKIDILWYDVARPMEHWEGWQSLSMNQMVRELQPEIIINNRSRLEEDFGTPEEHITAMDRDWEACMTFNGLSWGYTDSAQAAPYSYNAQQILKMLGTVAAGGGNLLLNIGPAPDGSVPAEAVKPLETVGAWLGTNGAAVYGPKRPVGRARPSGAGGISASGNRVYFWCRIWPHQGEMALGGFMTPLKAVRLLEGGRPVKFRQNGQRIVLQELPEACPDAVAGVAVFELEFETEPRFERCSAYPQLHGGRDYSRVF